MTFSQITAGLIATIVLSPPVLLAQDAGKSADVPSEQQPFTPALPSLPDVNKEKTSESLEKVLERQLGVSDADDKSGRQVYVFRRDQTPTDDVLQSLRDLQSHDKELKFEVDSNYNQLFIYATPEQFKVVSDMLARAGESEELSRKRHVFQLKHTRADTVARALQELHVGNLGFSVVVDLRSNSIVVYGTQAEIREINALVANVDEPAPSPPAAADENGADTTKDTRVFRTDGVNADLARRVLSTLMEGSKDFRIEADPIENQLVVAGTADEMGKVDTILKTLGALPSSSETSEQADLKQRVFTLTHPIDAKELLERFESRFGDDGKWGANFKHDRIEFFGTEEQVEAAAELVAELSARDVKIFSLQRSDAVVLGAVLKDLFPESQLTVAVDDRTNSIVATATKDTLDVVHALLLSLDAEETVTPRFRMGALTTEPKARTGSAALDDSEPDDLDDKYASSERNAATRAAIYRWAEAAGGSPDEELRKMKADLEAAVERAFAARQEAQSAEVDALRKQLSAIETRVRQREAIKDQIIERRVEDLLANVDTSWWPQAPAAPGDGTVTEVRQLPESLDPQELPNPQGKVQVEYVEGLDIIVIRGKESDVQAVQEAIQKIEQKAADSQPAGSTAEEPSARP